MGKEMINIKNIIGLCAFVCLFCACKSQQQNTEIQNIGNESTHFSLHSVLQKTQSTNTSSRTIVSKVHTTIALGDKELSTTGTMRMKKDEVIRISLVDPLIGIMEIGELEFTQDRLLILIRVKKEYIEVPYTDLPILSKAKISFNSIQSLLWNQIFEPGYFTPNPQSFTYEECGDNVNIIFLDELLKYVFQTSTKNKLLTKTTITDNYQNYKLICDYDDFINFEGGQLPRNIKLSISGDNHKISLKLNMQSPRTENEWATRTSIPSEYKKIKPEELFRSVAK